MKKIARCERLYAEAGLPVLFRITPLMPPDLDALLKAGGYKVLDHTLQQVGGMKVRMPNPPAGITFHTLPSNAGFQTLARCVDSRLLPVVPSTGV